MQKKIPDWPDLLFGLCPYFSRVWGSKWIGFISKKRRKIGCFATDLHLG
jgi:hypothetical protein